MLKAKGKVKVMNISTVTVSQTVRDMANVIIAIKYEDVYGLAIRVFRFDLVLL